MATKIIIADDVRTGDKKQQKIQKKQIKKFNKALSKRKYDNRFAEIRPTRTRVKVDKDGNITEFEVLDD